MGLQSLHLSTWYVYISPGDDPPFFVFDYIATGQFKIGGDFNCVINCMIFCLNSSDASYQQAR